MLNVREALKSRLRRIDEIPFKKKGSNILVLITAFLLLSCIGTIGWFHHRMRKLESKQKTVRRSVKRLEYGAFPSTPRLGGAPIPNILAGVPFGEAAGIVLAVKKVDIRNVTAPYNPSLIESSFGYDLFFRYDVINPKLDHARFSSRIGVVSLDHQFEQGSQEFVRIDLKSEYADDPRILMVGNQLYLFCNRLDEAYPKCRFMCAANLDRNTYAVNYSTTLDMNLHWVEKNWSPFEYIGNDQKSHLFLEYRINP